MSETMGFSALPSPIASPPAPFPATPRLPPSYSPYSGTVPAAAVRTVLSVSCYQRRCRSLRFTPPLPRGSRCRHPAVHVAVTVRFTLPSPCGSRRRFLAVHVAAHPAVHAAFTLPATARLRRPKPERWHTLTRLISRSTPYLTFLQHQPRPHAPPFPAPAQRPRLSRPPHAPASPDHPTPPPFPDHPTPRISRIRCHMGAAPNECRGQGGCCRAPAGRLPRWPQLPHPPRSPRLPSPPPSPLTWSGCP